MNSSSDKLGGSNIPIFKIGATTALDDPVFLQLDKINSIDVLFQNFIVEITLLPKGYLYRVDAFRVLYATISASYCLYETKNFKLDMGEGLDFGGRLDETAGIFNLSIFGGSRDPLSFDVTISQLLVLLAGIIRDLKMSISTTGIDVYRCLEKFPPALF